VLLQSIERLQMRANVQRERVRDERLVLALVRGAGHAEHAEVRGEARHVWDFLRTHAAMRRAELHDARRIFAQPPSALQREHVGRI
jgi:hypothetical protein